MNCVELTLVVCGGTLSNMICFVSSPKSVGGFKELYCRVTLKTISVSGTFPVFSKVMV